MRQLTDSRTYLSAALAHVRLLTGVYSRVYCQRRPLDELLATACKVANVRSVPAVDPLCVLSSANAFNHLLAALAHRVAPGHYVLQSPWHMLSTQRPLVAPYCQGLACSRPSDPSLAAPLAVSCLVVNVGKSGCHSRSTGKDSVTAASYCFVVATAKDTACCRSCRWSTNRRAAGTGGFEEFATSISTNGRTCVVIRLDRSQLRTLFCCDRWARRDCSVGIERWCSCRDSS